MHTALHLGGGTRTQTARLPPFTGVSPRVSARGISAHRGEYVSLVLKPSGLDAQSGLLNAICVVTGEEVEVLSLPSNVEVAQVNEFVCYVDPSTGKLEYYHHGTYNDEYDTEVYRKLLELCPKFPQLF
ncbi:putative Replication factor A protein 3 [Trypanosoma vivax]|uniref:Replication factor A protein 3 n=1 Tax=Trypanosoma vivax (strain Y486) TaxID=1055687 RepID=G0U387_TRYVY|nr:hypothetical protein TRVL_04915 [Trypanosoma vivax]KAH8604244.1 putative Replication factor A protein 3 [Trypanosoma vivax]CCC50743.1 conserved hypothetical protein [Trypanosoma vivax Y486]